MSETKRHKLTQAALAGVIVALAGAYAACAGDDPYIPTGASIHVQLPCPCDAVDSADDATAATLPAAASEVTP